MRPNWTTKRKLPEKLFLINCPESERCVSVGLLRQAPTVLHFHLEPYTGRITSV